MAVDVGMSTVDKNTYFTWSQTENLLLESYLTNQM